MDFTLRRRRTGKLRGRFIPPNRRSWHAIGTDDPCGRGRGILRDFSGRRDNIQAGINDLLILYLVFAASIITRYRVTQGMGFLNDGSWSWLRDLAAGRGYLRLGAWQQRTRDNEDRTPFHKGRAIRLRRDRFPQGDE
ncbi:hypothetical protein EHS39_08015 [Ensifer sp. MPMI2T]|nr:hypothetical protein EHS39_08015 [Ensifer sp. MPMI2T]